MFAAFLSPALPNRRRPLPRNVPRCSLLAVAGATGGVGRLIVSRLLDDPPPSSVPITSIRALVRSSSRASSTLPSSPNLAIQEVPPLHTATPDQLRPALAGVVVLVICIGTTAYPTRAWANGNTPNAIDDHAVRNLVSALDSASIRRIVLMSSIGTSLPRARAFPFFILNAFGVLDAKRRGEQHVVQAARNFACSYAIVRPGRLVGAPHSNIGVMQVEPDRDFPDIVIKRGDILSGDLSREDAAEAISYIVGWNTDKDLDICITNGEGTRPGPARWRAALEDVQAETLNNVSPPP